MFKSINKKEVILAIGLMILSTTTSFAADGVINGNLRVVIGTKSTGGDTYQNSSIVAKALAKKLGIHVKVDAVGGSAGFKALDRAGVKGNTIMIFHDQAYLGYLYGKKGYFDIFSKYIIGPSIAINPGNAYLVPKKSPYQTVEDIIDA
ncbi:MAG: ABC transporter substrate-binding protein, partial [Ostreibacterium sp.]